MHSTTRRWLCALAVLPAVLLAAACGGGEDRTKAHVRLLNGTLGYSALQLTLDDTTVTSSAAYGGSDSYGDADAGTRDASVSRPGSATVLSTSSVSLSKNKNYTLLAYGKSGQLGTLLLDENEGDAANGKAIVRVVNAAPDAGSLDVYLTASSDTLADATAVQGAAVYPKVGGFVTINSGTWRLRVTAAGSKTDVRLDVGGLVFGSAGVSTLVLTPGRGGVLVSGLLVPQRGAIVRADNVQARVRVVAGATDGAAVSVSVDGIALATGAGSPSLTGYSLLGAGVTVPVAASANGQTAALTSITLGGGGDYTLMVYGTPAAPQAVLLEDDNSLATDTTMARLRLVHGLADLAGTLAMAVDFEVVADGVVQGGASGYTEVLNSTTAQLTVTGGSATIYNAADRTFLAGANYTVFVVGNAATATAILRKDR